MGGGGAKYDFDVQHMLRDVQHMLRDVQHMCKDVQHMCVTVRIKLTQSS